jgi:hypothetical protein
LLSFASKQKLLNRSEANLKQKKAKKSGKSEKKRKKAKKSGKK